MTSVIPGRRGCRPGGGGAGRSARGRDATRRSRRARAARFPPRSRRSRWPSGEWSAGAAGPGRRRPATARLFPVLPSAARHLSVGKALLELGQRVELLLQRLGALLLRLVRAALVAQPHPGRRRAFLEAATLGRKGLQEACHGAHVGVGIFLARWRVHEREDVAFLRLHREGKREGGLYAGEVIGLALLPRRLRSERAFSHVADARATGDELLGAGLRGARRDRGRRGRLRRRVERRARGESDCREQRRGAASRAHAAATVSESTFLRGKRMRKWAPGPSSTSMRPLCRFTYSLTIDNPRPLPLMAETGVSAPR